MKYISYSVLSFAVKMALFFPGISFSTAAATSSCGTSNPTSIHGIEQTPCILANGEDLTINKDASIHVLEGIPTFSDPYNFRHSAVGVGGSYNSPKPTITVNSIVNNGSLIGNSGITVTYSGSLGTLTNNYKISANDGAVWVSGHLDKLDNYGLIETKGKTGESYSILLTYAQGSLNNHNMFGYIGEILNRKKGTIEGISVNQANLDQISNFGYLTSVGESLSAIKIINGKINTIKNDGTINSLNNGIIVGQGGYLENIYNQSNSKGITANQDAIKVTVIDSPQQEGTQQISSPLIKQIINDSLIHGKINGIYVDKKGIIETINNLSGGVIQGDVLSIDNKGTINNIYNAGKINGNMALGNATLYVSGKGEVNGDISIDNKENINNIFNAGKINGNMALGNTTLHISGKGEVNGDITGTKESNIVIGGKDAAEFKFSHDIKNNVGTVTIQKNSKFFLGDENKTGNIYLDIKNDGDFYFNQSDKSTYRYTISGTGTVHQSGKNGTTILSGHNTYTGLTSIQAGTLQFDTWSGTSSNINIDSDGILALNLTGEKPFDGVIAGSGQVKKIGVGEITLNSNSSTFTGVTNVEEGHLNIGSQAQLGEKTSTLNVKGKIGGSGKIGGTTTIKKGGHLTGMQGSTLTFGSDLILNDGATVDISLDTADSSEPTLFDVLGKLTLAGTLNVQNKGSLSAGEYDIFHYNDISPNSSMTPVGEKPGSLFVDIDKSKKIVYLTNTDGKSFNYWIGGDGLWQVGEERNWTSEKGGLKISWHNADKFAVFANDAGTVQIDNGNDKVRVDGMQFSIGGYTLTCDTLTLEKNDNDSAIIRVGASNRSTKEMIATIDAQLTGAVTLEKTGRGTLILTADDNDYSGGTKVTQGILQIGNGDKKGSLPGDVVIGNQGTLAFNFSNNMLFNSNITGQGRLIKKGHNKLTLTGENRYTGLTEIQQGTLRQGKANAFSAVSSYTTGENTILDIGGFNTTISALSHGGNLLFGGNDNAVGRTLTIAGDYNGKNGTVSLSTKLAGDDSTTDRLVVNNSTSGTTHLAIKNVGGEGAPTHKGIKVVEVKGSSDGEFNLIGDYRHQSDPVIVAGAYAYRLVKNGTNNSDGNWYLRSTLNNSKPTNPTNPTQLYHAGVSVYEAYGRVLQTLNTPSALLDRINGREDRLRCATSDNQNPLPSGAWGLITTSYGKLSPRASTSGAENMTYQMTRAQVGMDSRLYENDQGSLVGGLFLQYSHIDAEVGSAHGKGDIRSKGHTVGGVGTWYGNQGFYLDSLAQLTSFSSDLNSKTVGQRLGNEKTAFGYALSLETGQRFDLTPAWSFTPQAQLVYSAISMRNFHDVFKTKINFGQSDNMSLRVGGVLDYNPKSKWRNDQRKYKETSNLYGLFNIRQELLRNGDSVDVAKVAFSSRNDRLWGEVGIGGSYGQGASTLSLLLFKD